ncbi:DUF922 domain-containing protein [Aminobacter sp. Piv2-1]|uniref:DUF922 domain-containing protein n=1 Tax=Aminobacter sp. Piv2-1 TaxID=3031122 RepID=UPI0030A0E136
MSRIACALIAVLAGAVTALGPADAGVRQTTSTRGYAVSGNTGAELLRSMDRNGPRHGFLTRAIAQTKYTVTWSFDVGERGGMCRLRRADARLSTTFIYPEASEPLPTAVESRWRTFLAGARRHEETHARLAREMVDAAERAVRGLSLPVDRGCIATRREIKARVDRVIAGYEARQLAFDAREHAEGGRVDRLIEALARGDRR